MMAEAEASVDHKSTESEENGFQTDTLQKSVEDALSRAAKQAADMHQPGADLLLVLHTLDASIKYGDENEAYLTAEARKHKTQLHVIRSTCVYRLSEDLCDSIQEMDKAVCCSRNPDAFLIDNYMGCFQVFCEWLLRKFDEVYKDVLQYLTRKKRLMQKLNAEKTAKTGALLLASQCCQLAHTIWSENRSVIKQDELVELLVDHADICMDLNLVEQARKDVEDAFGLGGNLRSLYHVSAKVGVHQLTVNDLTDENKLLLCNKVLDDLDEGLECFAQDAFLQQQKSLVTDLKQNIPKVETDSQSDTSSVDPDWLPDNERLLQKQKDRADVVKTKFKTNAVKSQKCRTKEVKRKGAEPEVSNAQLPAHVVQAASTIRAGTGATAGRNDARKKDKESVKYATKTFPGTGFQSQSNGSCPTEGPRRKKEQVASKKVYSYLAKSYIIRLCCDNCIDDQPLINDGDLVDSGCSNYYVRVRAGHTECRENRLVLQSKESNAKDDFSWICIRACPPNFKPTSDICESFLSGESCRQRNRCPFPHSEVEKKLWTKYFSLPRNGTASSIGVDGFIDDLHNSSLRVRYEVEQMWQKLKKLPAAEPRVICQVCWKKGNGEVTGKRPHAPECQNRHHWDDKSKKLVLDVGNERIIDPDVLGHEDRTDEECVAVEAVRECRKHLSGLKVTNEELIDEVKRLKQGEETISTIEQKQRHHLFRDHLEGFFYDNDSTSGSYRYPNITVDDESQIDVEEDAAQIYDDEDLEDTTAVCSSDLESSDDEAFAEEPYYRLKPVAEARELLVSQPDKYKRCIIYLDGPFSAKCRMLDKGFQVPRVHFQTEAEVSLSSENDDVIREVEIRGRANCGPCFHGDEVVVELKETRELDGDKIIYRGTVIAVLAKKTLRKAHTFVCRVDTFHSHLMKPLDGIAPKIHVVNSILKNQKYVDRKDELVAVYSMVNGDLKLQKIIKLDPRQRRDMLFVVKYLSWLPGKWNMYPLGYVVRVIKAGEDLGDSQKVIDLLCQIPTRPDPECIAAAASVSDFAYNDADDVAAAGMEDIRHQLTITIDPSGCQDVDDALTLTRLPAGGFLVGVHIADVGRFVAQGDVIDTGARRRMMSFYPATDKVYHMLPTRLSADVCSLLQDKDRCALSVYLETDDELKITDTKCRSPVCRSLITNDRQMTYEEAQLIIDEAGHQKLPWKEDNVKRMVVYLHQIAQRLRVARLRMAKFCSESDDPFSCAIYPESHQLIEEFMVQTNFRVAQFLVARFPESIPVRSQKAPDEDDIKKWSGCHETMAQVSLYFQQFDMLSNFFSRCTEDGKNDKPTTIFFLKSAIDDLKVAVKSGDLRKAVSLIAHESQHPLHLLAMNSWFRIQEAAKFSCYADLQDEPDISCHFSLKLPFYVQFTSPIRRFMDIVIHRFVAAALDNESAPYTVEKMRAVCDRANAVSHLSKKYQRACQLLHVTQYLKTPFFLPCVIEDFDDDGAMLKPVHLQHVKRTQRRITYSSLSLSDKPWIEKDGSSVILNWQRRLYDTRGNAHPNARARHNVAQKRRLDTQCHCSTVEVADWRKLLSYIADRNAAALCSTVRDIAEKAKQSQQSHTEHLEVTSEMRGDDPIVRHLVPFEATFTRGMVVAVQFGAECQHGYVQPVPRLLNLTPDLDLCIEHRTDAVKCFAELATEKVLDTYKSIQHYQSVWLPILAMEAASKTTQAGDPIVCNNVPVSLIRRNDKYYGQLRLSLDFCKKRCIKLFNNSKDGEEDASDYLCLRYRTGQNTVFESATVKCTSMVRNVWVCHAVADYVHVTEDKDVQLKFLIQHTNSDPPQDLLNAGTTGKPCTVEFLTKLLPDRRMEDAVKAIPESSDMCKKIVLGHNVDDIPGDITFPKSDTYDIGVDADIMLNRNNCSQITAIRTALEERFTLIQGPPGTGKTLTAVKLVYWYVHMNKEHARSGGSHRQILYCGPSNSSVDVAAKLLKTKLGSKCPRIIRVYSEMLENQVFPIPRDSLLVGGSRKGRRYELIDKDDQRDISLHHLIRKESNKFSKKIREFDRLFEANQYTPENVTDKKIDEYKKLIKDASVDELRKYDVILCTCAASASPRLIAGANISQIVIDEGGMCMEPECLVPLVTFKDTNQVVLIGDHKQLQPIVFNTVAKNLGLEKSLFERYKIHALMLTEQYRMHPLIAEFPSERFYDGKLLTAPDHECRGIRLLSIWPRRNNISVPLMFCHVEGAEKALAVSTAEGNEQSRSNDAERDEAVRIFLELVNWHVDPNKITILSQYRAQCSAIEKQLVDFGYEHPNVGTVIASQGDEWDYVILSLVRSKPVYEIERAPSIGWCKRNMGFIIDEHQMNVALTRARLGLIIIGNEHLLRCDDMWRKLLQHFKRKGCIRNAKEFLQSRNRILQRPQQQNDQQQRPYTAHEQQSRYPRQQSQQSSAVHQRTGYNPGQTPAYRGPGPNRQGSRHDSSRPGQKSSRPSQNT